MKQTSEEQFKINALIACLVVSMCANFYGFVILPAIEKGDADTILVQDIDPAYFEGERVAQYMIPEETESLNIAITPAPVQTPSLQSDSKSNTRSSLQYDGVTVYVTKSGEKFHRETCSSLSKSKIPMLYEDASAKGYAPCGKCKP